MRFSVRRGTLLTRRRLLTTALATGAATLADGVARPYLSRAADRPLISHGLQSGDVSADSGVVWARADRPSRMQVEIATSDSFSVLTTLISRTLIRWKRVSAPLSRSITNRSAVTRPRVTDRSVS